VTTIGRRQATIASSANEPLQKKHGFEAMTTDKFFRWAENNHELLQKIAKANGAGDQSAAAVTDQYKSNSARTYCNVRFWPIADMSLCIAHVRF